MKQKSSKAKQNVLSNIIDKDDITHLSFFPILEFSLDYQTTF